MKTTIKDNFLYLWKKYFTGAELPIALFYSEDTAGAVWAKPPQGHSCIIGELARVRKGESLVYNSELVKCGGAKKYLGFSDKMRPGFEYFLSTGNEQIEGERYLKSPEMVLESLSKYKQHKFEGKNLVFKRWDNLSEDDNPEVVIFFAKSDVLSGLFTLANFDRPDGLGVFTPFGPGCGAIVHFPYLEISSDSPRAVIGMFDPSARTCVPKESLSFAAPYSKFEKMVENMEESFLLTETWNKVLGRISNGKCESKKIDGDIIVE